MYPVSAVKYPLRGGSQAGVSCSGWYSSAAPFGASNHGVGNEAGYIDESHNNQSRVPLRIFIAFRAS